jgi:hypothetical protein
VLREKGTTLKSTTPRRLFLVLLVLGTLGVSLSRGQQTPTGSESAALVTQAGYLPQWPPGPPPGSVPSWAQPGRISFSRWDGGPIETAKAFLSGWPGFNPPIPDYVHVMTNWYHPSTVEFLRRANINLIWVTFSNGFSIPTERRQRDMLRTYIDLCHRHGIHVIAYESVANMFWEDMYEHEPQSRHWVSIGKDGKPVPYGAADPTKMGRVTRYMADLSNPRWRDYLLQRIDLAIDAGADGIIYDNAYSAHLVDVFTKIMRHALGKKKDFLVMANFHRAHFILNRLLNAITTEEGGEAGVFTGEKTIIERGRWDSGRWMSERKTMLRVEGGYLANNIGLLRVFENLSEGWKPVAIESNERERGERFTHVMSGPRQQLTLAESMMFNVASELFVEGRVAHGLWHGEPEVVKTWEAVGLYNRFFASNRQYYTGARSQAALAIVLDNRSEGIAILNALAGRKVLFNVLYEHELTCDRLQRFSAVVLLTAESMRREALTALEQYVHSGGKLFVATRTATSDEFGRRREPPAWFGQSSGKGQIVRWEKLPDVDELARQLLAASPLPTVRVQSPPSVLYNLTEQPQAGRRMVHLLNYSAKPAQSVVVSVNGHFNHVTALLPEGSSETPPMVRTVENRTEIELSRLKIYALLVLQ